MSPGQHKASSTLMAYIQDVLDTENFKLFLLCTVFPAVRFAITKNPTCSTCNRCATAP